MSKRRNYRKKVATSEDKDEEEDVSAVLGDRKEMQKFRNRAAGVNVKDLAAIIDDKTKVVEKKEDDPFKLKSGGGLVDGDTAKDGGAGGGDLSNFGTTFSSETNQRDEDKQLLKYIEEEMKKRKGIVGSENDDKKQLTKEDLLYQLPENLKVQSKIMKSEEMLSSQVLSGIPEVDLGIDAKIKNIEATEEAKMKMIEEQKNRKQQTSEFVPTNMAANFLHHSRFFDEKKALDKERKKEKHRQESQQVPVDKGPTVGGEIVENSEGAKILQKMAVNDTGRKRSAKSTHDDSMFDSFKKKAKERNWR